MSDEKLEGYETVPLNMEKEELFNLMLMAHEQDITLNKLVENILIKYIESLNDKSSV